MIFAVSQMNIICYGAAEDKVSKPYRDGDTLAKAVLKAKRDGKGISKPEEKELISKASSHALEEYLEMSVDEAQEILEDNFASLDESEVYKEEHFDLPSGGSFTIKLSDQEESTPDVINTIAVVRELADQNVAAVFSSVFFSMALHVTHHKILRTVYKDYGARYFTAEYLLSLPPYGTFGNRTENHYTISDSGLSTRYGKTEPFSVSGFLTVPSCSWKITDSSAKTVGTDINIYMVC